MMMPGEVLRLEGWGFLVLLAATVAFRLLTRRIGLAGLLGAKDGSGGVSPERVQLLLATLALGAKYIGEVVHGTGVALPDVSAQWLYVFGASSGIYGSVKALRTFKKA